MRPGFRGCSWGKLMHEPVFSQIDWKMTQFVSRCPFTRAMKNILQCCLSILTQMEMGETAVHPSEDVDVDLVVDELIAFLQPPTTEAKQVRT